MGMFAALVIGYVIGARAGSGNLEEVRDALAALRESEELADLAAAVRAHAGHTLRALASMVDSSSATDSITIDSDDLVDEVKQMFARPEPVR
jgi:hypothetical protein